MQKPGSMGPMMGPMMLDCPRCKKHALTQAVECPKCGNIFVMKIDPVKNLFDDKCPKCHTSYAKAWQEKFHKEQSSPPATQPAQLKDQSSTGIATPTASPQPAKVTSIKAVVFQVPYDADLSFLKSFGETMQSNPYRGTLPKAQAADLMRRLQSIKNMQIISRPRITTFEHQRATVQIGQDVKWSPKSNPKQTYSFPVGIEMGVTVAGKFQGGFNSKLELTFGYIGSGGTVDQPVFVQNTDNFSTNIPDNYSLLTEMPTDHPVRLVPQPKTNPATGKAEPDFRKEPVKNPAKPKERVFFLLTPTVLVPPPATQPAKEKAVAQGYPAPDLHSLLKMANVSAGPRELKPDELMRVLKAIESPVSILEYNIQYERTEAQSEGRQIRDVHAIYVPATRQMRLTIRQRLTGGGENVRDFAFDGQTLRWMEAPAGWEKTKGMAWVRLTNTFLPVNKNVSSFEAGMDIFPVLYQGVGISRYISDRVNSATVGAELTPQGCLIVHFVPKETPATVVITFDLNRGGIILSNEWQLMFPARWEAEYAQQSEGYWAPVTVSYNSPSSRLKFTSVAINHRPMSPELFTFPISPQAQVMDERTIKPPLENPSPPATQPAGKKTVGQGQPKTAPNTQPATSQVSSFAWQRTDRYLPPDPEHFFADNPDAGQRLDALFRAPDKDQRSDEEILDTVQQGFRHAQVHRTLVLAWIGNRYIWGKQPQNPRGIEIMYHAIPWERHYAIYFGLSVVQPKTPNILRTLAEVCLQADGEDVGRITWGVGTQRAELVAYIEPYLKSPDQVKRETAEQLLKHFRGEIDFEKVQRDRAVKQTQAEYAGQMPELRRQLREGKGDERRRVIDVLNGNWALVQGLDDSFLDAFQAAAQDSDAKVRERVARMVGSRWIWSAQNQNPQAVDLMLTLSRDPVREVRYKAVYFGLSTVKSKNEAVVRQLVEIALEDWESNMHGRIMWGLTGPMRTTPEQIEKILNDLQQASAGDAARMEKISALRDELSKEK